MKIDPRNNMYNMYEREEVCCVAKDKSKSLPGGQRHVEPEHLSGINMRGGMEFTPRFSSPQGTANTTGGWGQLTNPKRIIIHHTAGTSMPSATVYHFAIDVYGVSHFRLSTTRISGATSNNNDDSIQIAVIGNWDHSDMGDAQRQELTNLIADCILSFDIEPSNQFTLQAHQMQQHFAQGTRQTLPVANRRHQNPGIHGHEDGLGEATRCPGFRLYSLCRDTIVPNAISLASGGWQEVGGEWYFYIDGERQTGWVEYNNSWFYLGGDGRMRRDYWLEQEGSWFYLDENGLMAQNRWVPGDDGAFHFVGPTGLMIRNDWHKIFSIADGGYRWFRFDYHGRMLTGWFSDGMYEYFLRESGAMVVGWYYIHPFGHLYFDNDGRFRYHGPQRNWDNTNNPRISASNVCITLPNSPIPHLKHSPI